MFAAFPFEIKDSIILIIPGGGRTIVRLLSLPVSEAEGWISLQFDFVFALILTF